MPSVLLEERKAESKHFGIKVFGAQVRSLEDARRLLREWEVQSAALAVVRVPVSAMGAAQLMEHAGARLCDVLVTMSRTHAGVIEDFGPPDACHIRPGTSGDAALVHGVGTSSFRDFVGHWHADERIPVDLAGELYGRWAADLARASSKERPLWIAYLPGGEVIGFLGFEACGPLHWHVPLAGVLPAHRGRGVLRHLLSHAIRQTSLRHQQEPTRYDYETQLSNVSALRSVAKCGLSPVASRLTFHLWACQP